MREASGGTGRASPDKTILYTGPPPPTGPGGGDAGETQSDGRAEISTDNGHLENDRSTHVTRDDFGIEPLSNATVVRLRPGDLVPGTRYRILGWLGDGGMGVVYEAEHVEIERRVALKILRPEFSTSATAIASFRDEARAATRAGSSNIVEVIDFMALPDGRVMVAMELLQGETLADLVRRGPVDPGRAIGILRQVCKALKAAHDAGIIHRDVKPENIMLVRERGRPDSVKVLDFGIAAITADDTGQQSSGAGTPHYMAPEQAASLPFDHRLDMYGFGCTAFALLTGRLPFTGTTTDELIEQHLTEKPRPPSEVRDDGSVPEVLDKIVLRCLAKSPDDRYENMLDLEAALCEAEIEAKLQSSWDDLPIPEVDPERRDWLLRNMPEPPGLIARARRPWMAAAAILIVGVLGVGVMALRQAPVAGERASEVEQHTIAARAAAAGAFFVYPPADDPGRSTAYGEVLRLESLEDGDELAQQRAQDLRNEFAATLARLGDSYWEQPGGQAFAIDYYAQALVFVPDHPRARERATLTPGELAQLRSKAEQQSFTEAELVAAEPLLVLAEADEEARLEGLEGLVTERADSRASSTTEKLNTLLAKKRKRGRRHSKPASEQAPAVDDDGQLPAGSASAEDAEVAPSRRHVEAAGALVESGNRALARSDWKQAERLFTQALVKDHRNAKALIGLSDLYFERTRYRKAVSFARKAVAIAGRNAEYRLKLGDAYFKVLRYEDARKQYKKAADLGLKRARDRIALVEAKLGK